LSIFEAERAEIFHFGNVHEAGVCLVVLPVPEPTTGLLLLGGLCLFARRKRAKG
jgi:hypothetical protein